VARYGTVGSSTRTGTGQPFGKRAGGLELGPKLAYHHYTVPRCPLGPAPPPYTLGLAPPPYTLRPAPRAVPRIFSSHCQSDHKRCRFLSCLGCYGISQYGSGHRIVCIIYTSPTMRSDNPLKRIIGLSVILSMGFLLVILAGINGNWFPIIDGIIFAVAYLPIAITSQSFASDYDFNFDPQSSSSSIKEAAQFLSSFLVVSAIYLPIILHNSHYLTKTATILTIVGGSLIYGTVYTFVTYFDETSDEVDDLGGGVI